uniref:Caspase-14 n=1 Tax=Pelusios castaneus TaxID=367368 RepID=A0A8C8RM32_9SAUR
MVERLMAGPFLQRYNMEGARLALTFCVTKEREGAEKDIEALEIMFNALGFQNELVRDPNDFKEKLEQFRNEIDARKDQVSCCFVIIMAHGNRDTVFGANDEGMNLKELFAEMTNEKCKALQGKPKVFIVQACRGVDSYAACSSSPSPGNDKLIPTHSDSLFIYATTPGYVAYRNELDGSWLIQAMSEVFKKSRGRHIMELLTEVRHFPLTSYCKKLTPLPDIAVPRKLLHVDLP